MEDIKTIKWTIANNIDGVIEHLDALANALVYTGVQTELDDGLVSVDSLKTYINVQGCYLLATTKNLQDIVDGLRDKNTEEIK